MPLAPSVVEHLRQSKAELDAAREAKSIQLKVRPAVPRGPQSFRIKVVRPAVPRGPQSFRIKVVRPAVPRGPQSFKIKVRQG